MFHSRVADPSPLPLNLQNLVILKGKKFSISIMRGRHLPGLLKNIVILTMYRGGEGRSNPIPARRNLSLVSLRQPELQTSEKSESQDRAGKG